MHRPLPSCHLSYFPPRLSSFHACSSVRLCFTHLHPHHETCQRVNSHTPGLHSTLMLSHDKLLSLSLISNLLLLLFPPLSFCLSHKMSLFRLKTNTYPQVSDSDTRFTDINKCFLGISHMYEHSEDVYSRALMSSCLDLHQSL